MTMYGHESADFVLSSEELKDGTWLLHSRTQTHSGFVSHAKHEDHGMVAEAKHDLLLVTTDTTMHLVPCF